MSIRTYLLAAGALLAIACGKDESPAIPAAAANGATTSAFEAVKSPAGPGAAEPFLFTSRTGVGLSWLEPVPNTDRVALRVAVFRDGAWGPVRTVVDRSDLFVNWADFPSVIEDPKGTLFSHWLQKSGADKYAYDVRMATSSDGGATWSAPFLLNRDGKQSEHGFVSLAALPAGGVGAAWLDGRNMTMGSDHEGHGDMTVRYAEVDAKGTLLVDESLDERTCECCATGMTVASRGPVIVYRDRSADETRDISVVRNDGGTWTMPQPIRADGWKINGCPVNGPQADAKGMHVAVAWFTGANEQPRVYAAFSKDGGGSFGKPVTIDDGKPAGRVDVVMLDEKTAVVSWLEQTAGGAEIRARRVPLEGTAPPSVKIADSATARASGFPRMAALGNEVWFAWTGQAGDQKQVQVGRTRF